MKRLWNVIVTGQTKDDDFWFVRNLSERIRQPFGLRVRIEPPMEVDHSFEFGRFIGLVFGDGDQLLPQALKASVFLTQTTTANFFSCRIPCTGPSNFWSHI